MRGAAGGGAQAPARTVTPAPSEGGGEETPSDNGGEETPAAALEAAKTAVATATSMPTEATKKRAHEALEKAVQEAQRAVQRAQDALSEAQEYRTAQIRVLNSLQVRDDVTVTLAALEAAKRAVQRARSERTAAAIEAARAALKAAVQEAQRAVQEAQDALREAQAYQTRQASVLDSLQVPSGGASSRPTLTPEQVRDLSGQGFGSGLAAIGNVGGQLGNLISESGFAPLGSGPRNGVEISIKTTEPIDGWFAHVARAIGAYSGVGVSRVWLNAEGRRTAIADDPFLRPSEPTPDISGYVSAAVLASDFSSYSYSGTRNFAGGIMGDREPSVSATWRGAMLGASNSGDALAGDAVLTYSVADNTVDVAFSQIAAYEDGIRPPSFSGPTELSWSGLTMRRFGTYVGFDDSAQSDDGMTVTIDVRFYGPNAEETAGTFSLGASRTLSTGRGMSGGWLAIREDDS